MAPVKKSKEHEQRERILAKYIENTSASFSSISKDTNIARKTVSDVIKRYRETSTLDRAAGSGRQRFAVTPQNAQKVEAAVKRKPGVSNRDLEKSLKISSRSIRRIKKENNIKTFKCQKAPHRNDAQHAKAKSRARKLYDEILSSNKRCILIDDETKVKADFKQLPGPKFYSKVAGTSVAARYGYNS